MIVIETGLIWRLVAKRFEDRVNKLCASGGWEVSCFRIEHRFLGLRVIFGATLDKCEGQQKKP